MDSQFKFLKMNLNQKTNKKTQPDSDVAEVNMYNRVTSPCHKQLTNSRQTKAELKLNHKKARHVF